MDPDELWNADQIIGDDVDEEIAGHAMNDAMFASFRAACPSRRFIWSSYGAFAAWHNLHAVQCSRRWRSFAACRSSPRNCSVPHARDKAVIGSLGFDFQHRFRCVPLAGVTMPAAASPLRFMARFFSAHC
jgi:hypothetical protein